VNGGKKGKGRREGREKKARGADRDEGPLTKILNTPLDRIMEKAGLGV